MNELTLLRCISDETRFKILGLLQNNGDMCVSHIVDELEKDQPLVSHHLKALKRCGIVTSKEKGKMTMYMIANAQISDLIKSISKASRKIATICADPSCCK